MPVFRPPFSTPSGILNSQPNIWLLNVVLAPLGADVFVAAAQFHHSLLGKMEEKKVQNHGKLELNIGPVSIFTFTLFSDQFSGIGSLPPWIEHM